VEAVEGRVARLEDQVTGMDRDLKAYFVEFREAIGRDTDRKLKPLVVAVRSLDTRLTRFERDVRAAFAGVDARLDGLDARLTRVERRLDAMNAKLDTLLRRVAAPKRRSPRSRKR
jgi:uncharacterized coiled-coil protein SlyX